MIKMKPLTAVALAALLLLCGIAIGGGCGQRNAPPPAAPTPTATQGR